MMPKVLSVNRLRRLYGDTVAVDGVSFEVGPGEIVGLLGPNGAGKTTTINMILGVLAATSGTIRIEGADIATSRSRALERTNFAAVYAPLPGNLTVYQNLRVFGLMYGVEEIPERIDALLDQFDLRRTAARQVRRALVGRADARLPRQGDAQPSAPPAPGRTDGVARPRDGARHPRHRFASSSHGTRWACFGPRTTCTKSRTSATACSSCRVGRILLDGDPRSLPREHGKETLEELFITVAREPLTLKRS